MYVRVVSFDWVSDDVIDFFNDFCYDKGDDTDVLIV